VGGGRNARVYKLDCGPAGRFVAKLYFGATPDGLDRLEVEFQSLQFLWDRGVRCIPQPVLADQEMRCAVYEFVEGEPIVAGQVTEADIEETVQFLALLDQLKTDPGSVSLPPAAEACFSVKDLAEKVYYRFERLISVDTSGPHEESLGGFLEDQYRPALEEITRWCRSQMSHHGILYDAVLGSEERNLSPSDFGFHNALRRSDGLIVFLDFEYFGWDDPAKTASDFLLHPAMDLPSGIKRKFVKNFLNSFPNRNNLARRLEIVYPLYGLKWCMILLNEFVPQDLLRRTFAGRDDLERSALQADQLEKSVRMLDRIKGEYERFPYYA